MTVAPFLPTPARAARATAAESSEAREGGRDAGFGAELAAALGTTPGERSGEAPAADTATTPATDTTPAGAGEPSEQDALLLAAMAGAVVLPTTAQTVAPPADALAAPDPSVGLHEVVAPAGAESTATTGAVPGTSAASLIAAVPGTQPAGTIPAAGVPGPAEPAQGAPTAASPDGATDLPVGDPATSAEGTVDTASTGDPGEQSQEQAGRPGAQASAPATSGAPATTPASAGSLGADAVAGLQGTTSATGARPTGEPAPPSPTTAVLRQVFPEITRVASAAGTHRIALTLNPESLGEVQVTVTVRAGEVQVSLGASTDAAQRALLEGTPELHRLLDRLGVESRVVVRDAAGPLAQSSTTDPARGDQSRGDQPADGRATAYADGQGGARRGWDERSAPETFGDVLDQGATAPTRPAVASTPARPEDPTGRGRLDRLM